MRPLVGCESQSRLHMDVLFLPSQGCLLPLFKGMWFVEFVYFLEEVSRQSGRETIDGLGIVEAVISVSCQPLESSDVRVNVFATHFNPFCKLRLGLFLFQVIGESSCEFLCYVIPQGVAKPADPSSYFVIEPLKRDERPFADVYALDVA